MTIKKKKAGGKIEIDLTGPQGNAFCLLSIAKDLSSKLGLDWEAINSDMKSGDYEHLVATFDKHFGVLVDLYR